MVLHKGQIVFVETAETVKYVSGFSSLQQQGRATMHFSQQFQQVKTFSLGVSIFSADQLQHNTDNSFSHQLFRVAFFSIAGTVSIGS